MKLMIALIGIILLSGCAENEDSDYVYSFHQIDHSKILSDTTIENRLDVAIDEDGMTLNEDELDELFLNIGITNRSDEELLVGNNLSLEKYTDGKWENVDSEDFAIADLGIDFLPDDTVSYGFNLYERLEENPEMLDGVFRLTNADTLYIYFSINRFVP